MIRCEDILREISELLDDDVTPEMRTQIESHLCACRHCKVLVDTTRLTLTLVSTHQILELPDGVSSRLIARLTKHLERSGPSD
jgi:anti-sigma factor RsiW